MFFQPPVSEIPLHPLTHSLWESRTDWLGAYRRAKQLTSWQRVRKQKKKKTGSNEEPSPLKGRPSLAFSLHLGPIISPLQYCVQFMNPLRGESVASWNPQNPVTSPKLVTQPPPSPLYGACGGHLCSNYKGPGHVGWGLGAATG